MTNFSPCNIEVLLHCYYSPDAHPREDAASVISSYKLLELCGLIEPQVYKVGTDTATKNKYKTTEKGRAHVKQLCTLPLPSSAWVDSNGKLIELT
jgi:DNA-binding PadR family transcriptional regulator